MVFDVPPFHRPDPDHPCRAFEHDGRWYQLLVLPAALSPSLAAPLSRSRGLLDDLVNPAVGTVAERIARLRDPRWKLLVYRADTADGALARYRVVAVELYDDRGAAHDRCVQLLSRWGEHADFSGSAG
ncbi:MAG: hypothetical protein FWE71_10530 [Nocardioidaceae bacterium]|nr:hypothetical protein [Nocardioidaceae bacterium]MCL2612850.1 hypothetical protein [Nocardioidaceae bacterium]